MMSGTPKLSFGVSIKNMGRGECQGDAGGLKTFDGIYGKFDIQMASNLWIRYPTLTVTCMLTRGMVRWIMVEHDGISD